MIILKVQIIFLWLLYPLGIMLHTLIALLPLFVGLSVKEDAMEKSSINAQKAMMMITSSIPLIFICGILFTDHAVFRWLNLAMVSLLCLANLMHLLKHIGADKKDIVQNSLLTLLLIFSLLLAFVSYQWCVNL